MELFDSNSKARQSRAPEVTPEAFFKIAESHSILKSDIVSKYIIGWANIIVRSAVYFKKDARVYVVDLFSGCGQYDDGTKSTPIKAIEQALKDNNLKNNIIFRFNDISQEMTSKLEAYVQNTPDSSSLKHSIKYTNFDAESTEVASWFTKNATGPRFPMLVFIDPFGYKQISRELLKSIIKIPKSDILFFFNYKRVNAALNNEQFISNMNKMFGPDRVQIIKTELSNARPAAREDIIIRHLKESLKEIGAVHVAPFVVVQEDEEQTSHYIVGITKHDKGYELLKKIMRQHSQIGEQGKAFGYDLASIAREQQGSIFGSLPDRIELLAAQLHKDFEKKTILFEQLYKTHHPTTEYTESEYKQAIRRLLTTSRAYNPDDEGDAPKRRTVKGEQAIPGHFKIRFI